MIPSWISNPDPNIFRSDNYVVLDFETTNIDKGSPRDSRNGLIYTYSSGPEVGTYSKFGSEYEHGRLLDIISSVDFIIAHNAKFELQWLARCGLDLSNVLVYDTLLGQYVLNGNRKSKLDLDSVAKRYNLGQKESFVSKLIKRGVCPSEIPKRFLKRYCIQDVTLTEQVFLKQREELIREGLLQTQFTRCIFTPALADIELNGMHLDSDRVYKKYTEFTEELLAVDRELAEFTGGINMQSPQQVAEYLYGELEFQELKDRKGSPIRGKPSKRFPDGAPRTDASTIASLRVSNNRQKKFIALKQRQAKLNTAITKYLKLFKEACDNNEGNLFGRFNQSVTQTHRLSSSKPNFQNFDRTFKPLFKSRNRGWKIGERDGSQLEFRVAAFLGQDNQAILDIEQGFDVHSYTASIIGCSRQEAKADTFKPLYGGQSGTKLQQRYYEAFKQKYKHIADKQEEWKLEVLGKKHMVTLTGLKFYWPDTTMTSRGYVTNSTNICNYPVQSLATAEIIPIAVTYMWYMMKDRGLNSFIINTIHDSVVTEEDPEETDVLNNIAEEAFTKYVYRYLKEVYSINFNVPLAVDNTITTNWGEK